jgi:hypothetical protein
LGGLLFYKPLASYHHQKWFVQRKKNILSSTVWKGWLGRRL